MEFWITNQGIVCEINRHRFESIPTTESGWRLMMAGSPGWNVMVGGRHEWRGQL
jgi:hypothetical protein